MMRRRFEAYKDVVVRPFFQDHFARLDRQIILVDALAAFNAGPDAVRDLEGALAAVLECFRMGRKTWASALLRPRVDRILFAATKADHLHHASHERLEAILSRMVERAAARASAAGAPVDVVALSAVRATREAKVRRGRDDLPCIIGVPAAGEVADGEVFDGVNRGRDVSGRPAGRSRPGVRPLRRASAGSPPRRRRTRISAFCACVPRSSPRSTAWRACPIFALTVRCNSCSETGCHERASPPAGRVPAR